MIKVVIIGAGNLATHLYRNIQKTQGLELIQMFNRNSQHLDFVGNPELIASKIDDIKEADIYLLAIKDEALADFALEFPEFDGLVAHCSGSENIECVSRFENYGVFYPLQSFSKERPVDFDHIPICLEANSEKNLDFLKQVAKKLSDQIFEVNSSQRKALHLSAVFVNNFSNHLFALAADYCEQNGLPFDILKPLIKETVDKIDSLPPFSAQTGPALRKDQKTIEAHLEMLDDNRKKIYTILTESIQKLHGKEL